MTATHSPRWEITSHVMSVLEVEFFDLTVIRNPRHAAALDKGAQVIFVKEQSDALLEAQGSNEKRKLTLAIAVVSRNEDADADADLLHQRLGKAVRRLAVAPATGVAAMPWRTMAEVDVRFSVEGLDVDGALIASVWEFTYMRRRDQDIRKSN